MKRDPTWGQDDPMSQLRVILGSIEGDMMNIVDGIASTKAAPRVLKHVRDATKLAEAISKGDCKWEE